MSKGRKKKFYSKEQIYTAMRHTKSIKALARYLGCTYQHIKPYMKMYVDEDTGKTFFELHKNQHGKNIPKRLLNSKKEPNVKEIFETGHGWESFDVDKIKDKGIHAGYLIDHCYICDFAERRVSDYKIPLLLNFKDGNKCNYLSHNLELLCYNCYFLYVADPLTKNQVKAVETNQTPTESPFKWGLDSEYLENMKEMGIEENISSNLDDEYELVTRKI